MSGRSRKGAAGALALLAGLLCADGLGAARAASPETAWTVCLTIAVKGEYSLEGRERSSGHYRMKFVWTGELETDGDDYILLHGRSDLAEWDVEETTAAPEGIRIRTANDFGEKPELNVMYVLRLSDGLHMNFFIRGFAVPRSNDQDAFYLLLPASLESGERPADANYSDFVKKGSNAIIVDDPASHSGTRKKSFHWDWLRRTSFLRQDVILLGTNRHEADVTVVISPKRQRAGEKD